MHEFSIAQQILAVVLETAKQHHSTRVVEVNLEIGELTVINPHQLRYSFKLLSEGTIAEGAKLRIRRVKAQILCNTCGYRGGIPRIEGEFHLYPMLPPVACPKCGSTDIEVIKGRECNVKNIKITKKEA